MIYKSTGFPKTVSDYIELPGPAELLLMPFMKNIDIDTAYKYGTEFQKHVFDKTNLTHKKKHINVSWQVVLLRPEVSPVVNINKNDKEWHVDGQDGLDPGEVFFHLMVNDTSSMTDFNSAEFEIDVKNSLDLIDKINHNEEVIKLLKPQQIESGRIYTFDNTHIHRANRSTKPEFRFIYRVVETDHVEKDAEVHFGSSIVWNGSTEGIRNITQNFNNGAISSLNIYYNEK